MRVISNKPNHPFDHNLFHRFGIHTLEVNLYSKDFGNGFANLVSEPPLETNDHYFQVGLLCLSRDKNDLEQFAIAEAKGDTEKAGFLLGYPSCCVESLGNITKLGQYWGRYYLEDFRRVGTASCYSNRFPIVWGGMSAVGELFPCGLNCSNAMKYSREMLNDMSAFGYGKIAKICIEHTMRPIRVDEKSGMISTVTKGCTQTISFR